MNRLALWWAFLIGAVCALALALATMATVPDPPDRPILPTPDGTATFAVAVETRAHELATGMRMATVAARHDEWSAHLTATWADGGGS